MGAVDNSMEAVNQVFDHIGYATKSMAGSRVFFASIGYELCSDEIEDECLGVRILFMVDKAGFKIELLENLPNSSMLNQFLGFGRGLYHLAYKVKDLRKSVDLYCQAGFKVLRGPVYAVAFQTEVCFLIAKNGPIVELIEERIHNE